MVSISDCGVLMGVGGGNFINWLSRLSICCFEVILVFSVILIVVSMVCLL